MDLICTVYNVIIYSVVGEGKGKEIHTYRVGKNPAIGVSILCG